MDITSTVIPKFVDFLKCILSIFGYGFDIKNTTKNTCSRIEGQGDAAINIRRRKISI